MCRVLVAREEGYEDPSGLVQATSVLDLLDLGGVHSSGEVVGTSRVFDVELWAVELLVGAAYAAGFTATRRLDPL